MEKINDHYWFNLWHLDYELHEMMNLKNVKQVTNKNYVSIYCDTDSLFVSFKPALDHCEWQHAYASELDFILDLDKKRIAGYFKKCLDEFAATYGVDNKQDFELERISKSVINIAKKKYIQDVVMEDGVMYQAGSYIFPKGVEMIRSSTPSFAREKIPLILSYLFSNPDTFNIRELLKIVKGIKREFDLCVPDRIDDIAMQTSCSKYDEKIVDDTDGVEVVSGANFAIAAAGYYNYLLNKNKTLQAKYEPIKQGMKIKYYHCNDKSINKVFAYIRGSYPIEFGPDINTDLQFFMCILSPINKIIKPLGLPEITKRLSVVMDIFGGL